MAAFKSKLVTTVVVLLTLAPFVVDANQPGDQNVPLANSGALSEPEMLREPSTWVLVLVGMVVWFLSRIKWRRSTRG